MTIVLDLTASQGGRSLFGFPLDGLEVKASDIDWASGSGEPLVGQSRDLLLLLAGRTLPPEKFSGSGARRLVAADR